MFFYQTPTIFTIYNLSELEHIISTPHEPFYKTISIHIYSFYQIKIIFNQGVILQKKSLEQNEKSKKIISFICLLCALPPRTETEKLALGSRGTRLKKRPYVRPKINGPKFDPYSSVK